MQCVCHVITYQRVTFFSYVLAEGFFRTMRDTVQSKLSKKKQQGTVWGQIADFRGGKKDVTMFLPAYEDFKYFGSLFTLPKGMNLEESVAHQEALEKQKKDKKE